MKQQDLLPSREFHIGNETKIDKLNMNIRNQLELQLVWYESKAHQIVKFSFILPKFWHKSLSY